MLHPRYHLLSDITALLEIDAVQAMHIGRVRERIAIHEVQTAARRAGGDAGCLVEAAVAELGANEVGDLLPDLLRDENWPGERLSARIGRRRGWSDGELPVR